MKNTKVGSEKIIKIRRMAGVTVRSGVKAGIEIGGYGGPGPERPGLFGHKVDKYGKGKGI